MKALGRFLVMFCTASTTLFLGLEHGIAIPKQMIMITGTICGAVNMIWGWLEGQFK